MTANIEAVPLQAQKCATCQHIGQVYHSNGFSFDHMCWKGDVRRNESMSPNADFFDHFRTFFDARADQAACKHYGERPIVDEATLRLLSDMGPEGRGEYEFFSKENSLACKLEGKFVRSDMHATKKAPGNRVFWLLPTGIAEINRVTKSTVPA